MRKDEAAGCSLCGNDVCKTEKAKDFDKKPRLWNIYHIYLFHSEKYLSLLESTNFSSQQF